VRVFQLDSLSLFHWWSCLPVTFFGSLSRVRFFCAFIFAADAGLEFVYGACRMVGLVDPFPLLGDPSNFFTSFSAFLTTTILVTALDGFPPTSAPPHLMLRSLFPIISPAVFYLYYEYTFSAPPGLDDFPYPVFRITYSSCGLSSSFSQL